VTILDTAGLIEADRRHALRHLARVWGTPCDHAQGISCVATGIAHLALLRELASPSLPAHDTTQPQRCDCLGCLWDEYRGALATLDGIYERTVHWQDVAPEYGVTDDPEEQFLIDLEMQVNGLLRDLMHGVGAQR
jgi:hypothetical protein